MRATSAASTFPHLFLRRKDTCLLPASVSELSANIGRYWHCCIRRSVAKYRSVFSQFPNNPRNCIAEKKKFKQPNNDLENNTLLPQFSDILPAVLDRVLHHHSNIWHVHYHLSFLPVLTFSLKSENAFLITGDKEASSSG